MSFHTVPGFAPKAYPREQATCGRCPKCHPGKQWGGDEKCTYIRTTCACHRRAT